MAKSELYLGKINRAVEIEIRNEGREMKLGVVVVI